MSALYDWLFQRVLRLDMSTTSPPWRLCVFNDATNAWEVLGQPPRGVLYEYGPSGSEFVLTTEGDVIGVRE